jgi:hypothetical protein
MRGRKQQWRRLNVADSHSYSYPDSHSHPHQNSDPDPDVHGSADGNPCSHNFIGSAHPGARTHAKPAGAADFPRAYLKRVQVSGWNSNNKIEFEV